MGGGGVASHAAAEAQGGLSWAFEALNTMNHRRSTLFVIFVLASGARGQDAPIVGRPANFSHLVGRFRVEAAIEPNEVVVEDPLTLRVTIRGSVAPDRSKLAIFPDDFDASFFVEPAVDLDRAIEGEAWEFVWKLRPKSTRVEEVPSLKLVHYNPSVRRFQTASSDPLPLKVKPRAELLVVAPTPVKVAESFLVYADSESRGPSEWLGRLAGLLACVIGGFLACRATEWIWPRRASAMPTRPDVARVLATIQANPALACDTLTGYLKSLLPMAAAMPTAREVEAALKDRGVGKALRQAWTIWWRRAEGMRFAPVVDEGRRQQVVSEATKLVRELEAEPCFASSR